MINNLIDHNTLTRITLMLLFT